MGDSEPKKETVFTKKEGGKDSTALKLKDIKPAKPGREVGKPPQIPEEKMTKEQLDSLKQHAIENARDKKILR